MENFVVKMSLNFNSNIITQPRFIEESKREELRARGSSDERSYFRQLQKKWESDSWKMKKQESRAIIAPLPMLTL